METHERELVLGQFNSSESHLLQLVRGLTPSQWNFRETPERWSIAETIEHVIAVETRLTRAIQKMLQTLADPAKRPATPVKDSTLQAHVTNRVTKLTAPEPVRPSGKWPDTAELVAEFRKIRAQTVTFVLETDANLRNHFIPHMAFGELDLYQWLIVLSQHGERHARQIEEIMANPAWPAGNAAVA
ncbi:MAG TPA: DinB family protein [Bryobacteraceae bacterium]|jgi:hypothetical protein|nr:DinB family protein [Bryobacteraceae bacterium]